MMMALAPPNFKELPFIETKPQAMSALSSVFNRCLKTLFPALHPRTFPETGTDDTTGETKNAAHVVQVLSSVEDDVAVKKDNEENKENIPPSPRNKKTVCFSLKKTPEDPFRTPSRRFSSKFPLSPPSPPPISRMPGFCFERAQYAAPGILPTMPVEFSKTSPAAELAIKAAAESAGCSPALLRRGSA